MEVYNKRIVVSLAGIDSKKLLDHMMSSVESQLDASEFPLRFSIFDVKKGKALVNVAVLKK